MIDRTDAPETSSPAATRRAFRSKVDSDPADVRVRGRLARARHRHDRACRRRSQPRCSVASSSRSRSSPPRWTRSWIRGWPVSWHVLGGLAVLNLEGVQARFDDPTAILERIATAADTEVHDILAEAYQQPIREDLIADRIEAIHAAGSRAAVAATPAVARRFGPFVAEHGADLFLVQSQVSSRAPHRDRVRPALPRRIHALHADPGRGRQHDECGRCVRADGAGGGGRVRRGRSRRGMHDPRGPRASGSRRSRPSATSPRRATRTSRTPVATSRSSRTAACDAAASSPRRSPRAPTS